MKLSVLLQNSLPFVSSSSSSFFSSFIFFKLLFLIYWICELVSVNVCLVFSAWMARFLIVPEVARVSCVKMCLIFVDWKTSGAWAVIAVRLQHVWSPCHYHWFLSYFYWHLFSHVCIHTVTFPFCWLCSRNITRVIRLCWSKARLERKRTPSTVPRQTSLSHNYWWDSLWKPWPIRWQTERSVRTCIRLVFRSPLKGTWAP